MRLNRATHLALALLVAAGLGVAASSAKAQTSTHKKTPSAKAGGSAHRARSSKKSSRRPRGQKAPTADRISEIQQALAKDGSFSGKPNGKWDDATAEALKNFQTTHGLNPTGKLDAKSLQQLGLGSQTAGVAAPMPPVSSSSTARPAQTVPRRR